LVIQSLFGRRLYQIHGAEHSPRACEQLSGLEILAARDEIIPDSTQAISWSTGPALLYDVPFQDVRSCWRALCRDFMATLFEAAGLDWATGKAQNDVRDSPGARASLSCHNGF